MKKLLSLCAVLALTAATVLADKFPEISLGDLKSAMAEDSVTILDVNGTEKYTKGHIPGAIDFAAEKETLATKLPENKDALIVAYCGSERCGAYARATQAAADLGYTNVQHFKPGLAGWKAAGEPLESAE